VFAPNLLKLVVLTKPKKFVLPVPPFSLVAVEESSEIQASAGWTGCQHTRGRLATFSHKQQQTLFQSQYLLETNLFQKVHFEGNLDNTDKSLSESGPDVALEGEEHCMLSEAFAVRGFQS